MLSPGARARQLLGHHSLAAPGIYSQRLKAYFMASESLREFKEIASEYCDWVRSYQGGDMVDAMRTLQRLLMRLHLAWITVDEPKGTLSDIDADGEDGTPIRQKFCCLLPVDGYLGVWDCLDFKDKEDIVVTRSLPDDVGDIFADISEGLAHWHQGREYDAYFQWNLLHDVHWGRHLSGALSVLFQYLHEFQDGSTDQRLRVWKDVAP